MCALLSCVWTAVCVCIESPIFACRIAAWLPRVLQTRMWRSGVWTLGTVIDLFLLTMTGELVTPERSVPPSPLMWAGRACWIYQMLFSLSSWIWDAQDLLPHLQTCWLSLCGHHVDITSYSASGNPFYICSFLPFQCHVPSVCPQNPPVLHGRKG